MSRSAAYKWLADQMGINPQFCHMKLLTEDGCARVVRICAPLAQQTEIDEFKALSRG